MKSACERNRMLPLSNIPCGEPGNTSGPAAEPSELVTQVPFLARPCPASCRDMSQRRPIIEGSILPADLSFGLLPTTSYYFVFTPPLANMQFRCFRSANTQPGYFESFFHFGMFKRSGPSGMTVPEDPSAL